MEPSPETSGGGTLLVLQLKPFNTFKTKDEYIYAMKEDLAEWFKCLYKIDIGAENFFDVLDTGVLLCEHCREVRKTAMETKRMGILSEIKSNFVRDIQVPIYEVSFRVDVKPQTFPARDNISNFIKWTRDLGIPDVLQFETDDLVLRKNEKSVVLCLLEIARIGAKLGMLAPTIVQMEEEIDAELAGEPPPQIKTCDLKSLDELVQELAHRCTCPVQFVIMKVGEGKYRVGESQTLVFIRILRTHVMIRVGGGWDTLEHYLNKHDPCRCDAHGYHRPAGSQASSGANPSQRGTLPRRASTPNVSSTLSSSGNSARKLSLASTKETADDISSTPKRMRSASTEPGSGRNQANSTTGRQLPVTPDDNSNGLSKRSFTNRPVSNQSPIHPRQRSVSPAPNVTTPKSRRRLVPGKPLDRNTPQSPRKSLPGGRSQSTPPIRHNLMDSSGNEMDSDNTDVTSGSGQCNNFSMERISTMTLEEFKNMLNSSLSAPNGYSTGTSSPESPRSQSSSENKAQVRPVMSKTFTKGREQQRSDSNVVQAKRYTEKDLYDRQKRNVPSSPVMARNRPRTPCTDSQNTTRNRPKTPNTESHNTLKSRPKTPNTDSQTLPRNRPRTPSADSQSILKNRPRTPSADSQTLIRSRPRTPNTESQTMVKNRPNIEPQTPVKNRPKTPTLSRKPNHIVPTTNNVNSLNATTSSSSRPTTLPVDVQFNSSTTGKYSESSAVCSENKVTDDLIKACMNTYRNVEAYNANIDKLDKEHSISSDKELCEYSSDSYVSSPASERSRDSFARSETLDLPQRLLKSQPERPSTPSLIPRPYTPTSQKLLSSLQTTKSEERPPIPKRPSVSTPTPKPKTGGVKDSYVGIYQARRAITPVPREPTNRPPSQCRVERSKTPGPGESSGSYKLPPRRARTPGPFDTADGSDIAPRGVRTPPHNGTSDNSEVASWQPRTSCAPGSINSKQFSAKSERTQPTALSVSRSLDYDSLQSSVKVESKIQSKPKTLVSPVPVKRQNTTPTPTSNTPVSSQRLNTTAPISRRCVTPTPVKTPIDRRPTTPSLSRQKSVDEEACISVSRHDGYHSVTVNSGRETPKRPVKIMARANSGQRDANGTASNTLGRERSRSVDITKQRQRSHSVDASVLVAKTFSAATRTEAWVETTTKGPVSGKPPLRRQRSKTPADLDDSYLESRPLEEIQKALTLPDGIQKLKIDELPPPPEDPEMFETMNLLFLKMQEKERGAMKEPPPSSRPNTRVAPPEPRPLANTSSSSNTPKREPVSRGDASPSCSTSKSSRDSESDEADLVREIKQILQVKPRKDRAPEYKTKIPEPRSFSSLTRSKSVSNIYSEKDDRLQRSETPVPKLSVPLTTGRTTFVNGKERTTTPGLIRVKSLDRPLSSLSQSAEARNFNYSLSCVV
ncbi:hypothetical protein ScPMuIL_005910 [Solemya velum]